MRKSVAWVAASALALSMMVVGVMSLSSSATPQRATEAGRVYFDLDQPGLSKAERLQLNKIIPSLKNAARIEVGGYAGTSKTAKSKVQRLALGRAKAVAAYLASHGVTAQMVVVSKGYATDTKDKAKMRRVTLVVLAYKANPAATCVPVPTLRSAAAPCPTPPFPTPTLTTPPAPTPTCFPVPAARAAVIGCPTPTCVPFPDLRAVVIACPTPPCVAVARADVIGCPTPTLPTPATVTYSLTTTLEAYAGTGTEAAYTKVQLGLGAPGDLTYSASRDPEWSCAGSTPSTCTTSNSVTAPAAMTSAWLKMTCSPYLTYSATVWCDTLNPSGTGWVLHARDATSVTFRLTLPAVAGSQTLTGLMLTNGAT